MTTPQSPTAAKCACGIKPTKLPLDGYKCQNEDCIAIWAQPMPCVENWNYFQEDLVKRDEALLREGFEAGMLRFDVHNEGVGAVIEDCFKDFLQQRNRGERGKMSTLPLDKLKKVWLPVSTKYGIEPALFLPGAWVQILSERLFSDCERYGTHRALDNFREQVRELTANPPRTEEPEA